MERRETGKRISKLSFEKRKIEMIALSRNIFFPRPQQGHIMFLWSSATYDLHIFPNYKWEGSSEMQYKLDFQPWGDRPRSSSDQRDGEHLAVFHYSLKHKLNVKKFTVIREIFKRDFGTAGSDHITSRSSSSGRFLSSVHGVGMLSGTPGPFV